jgi:hypothetical protein
MSGAVIDELVTLIGVSVASDAFANIRKMTEGLQGLVTGAAKLATGLAAAAAAGLYAAERFNKSTGEIGKLSDVTGVSTDSLQKWGYAVTQVGGNYQAIQSDIAGLTRTMSSPVIGEYNNELMNIGVSVYRANGSLKTADELLFDIADAMQGMPKQTQMQWASKLGISTDTLLLIQKGRGEIQKLHNAAQSSGTIISEDNIKKAREFTAAWEELQLVLSETGAEVAAELAPQMKEMAKALAKWVKENKPEIVAFFKAFASGALAAGKAIGKWITDHRDDIISFFDKLKTLGGAVVDALKAIADFVGGKEGSSEASYGEDSQTGEGDERSWVSKKFGKRDENDERSLYTRVKEGLFGSGEADAATIPPDKLMYDKPKDKTLSESVKPTASVKTSASVKEKEAQAMAYYQSRGYSKEDAAAIMGNLRLESGGSLDTGAHGDLNKPEWSQAHGIGQWRDDKGPGKGRFTDLKNFAAARGKSWEDYETQLAFVDWELQHTEKGAAGKLAAAQGLSAKTETFGKAYERPKDLSQSIKQREAYAQSAYNSAPNITINNNINGAGDPNAVAAKTAEKTDVSLQAMFSGGLAQSVQ